MNRQPVIDSGRAHDVDWTPERIERLWNYYSARSEYDQDRFSVHSGKSIAAWADRVVRLRGKRVLDYGCGTGRFLEHLVGAYAVSAVYGSDVAGEAQAAAQRLLGHEPRFGGVGPIDAIETRLQDAGVDIVFMIEVLEHLDDATLATVLDAVRRCLNPGGYLVVTVPNAEPLEQRKVYCPDCGAVFHPKQHVRRWDRVSLPARLLTSGYQPVRIIETNWMTFGRNRGLAFLVDRLRPILGTRGLNRLHLGCIARRA